MEVWEKEERQEIKDREREGNEQEKGKEEEGKRGTKERKGDVCGGGTHTSVLFDGCPWVPSLGQDLTAVVSQEPSCVPGKT